MKWFFILKERLQKRRQKPLVIRTIPQDQRSAPIERKPEPEQDSQAGIAVETNFGFSDSLSLTVQDDAQVNPYETYTWEQDQAQEDTRQLKKVDMIDRPKSKKVPNNPYDTGKFRKGWDKK